MFRVSILALLVAGLLTTPSVRAEDKPAADSAEKIIATLHEQKFMYDKDLRTTPYREVLDDLEKKHKVIIITAKAKFGDEGAKLDNMKAESLDTKSLDGMCLHGFLKAYMAALPIADVTYVVRPDCIEITTKSAVREEVGLDDESETAEATPSRINLPIVCLAVKEKQLSTVFDELRRVYGVNIVTGPGVKEQLKKPIAIQLLNVPADTALELIAEQADLGVVRKGNTFRIISNPGA